MKRFFQIAAVLVLMFPIAFGQSPGRVRTYYIAADEVDWDYAPGGVNKMMGMKFEGYSKVFTDRGPHRIGTVYRKAIYREYTDETFKQLKPRPAEWETAGILGPILRAEVGDTIKIFFKNNATHPYSMHPHGVFYDKDSEGAPYDDGTSGADKEDDAVPPGKTHTYTWKVPERAGPGPNDPSSIVWLYHSHTNELKDVSSGLVGAMIITRRGMADADGKPKDVDREFVCLFMLFDENVSWYLDHNIKTFTSDPKGVNKLEFAPVDDQGNFSGLGSGFTTANFKAAINGYIYGTGPMMTMKKGERVRWYLMALSEQFSMHTPHWHGNVVLHDGKRTDVVSLLQAQMETVDMVPDNPGTWMFHCHIDDHMEAGMVTLYKVEPQLSAVPQEEFESMRKQVAPAFLALVMLVAFLSFGPSARAADSAAPSYPDWAAAVVPAYPHALPSSGPVTPTLYGIETTDPMPTVVAWYKSRVHGAWSGSEGGNTWSVKSLGLRIQISANYYDDSGAEKPGTRVALTKYH